MPKNKHGMDPADRADMNEGIARALKNISGGGPKVVAEGKKAPALHVHAMNLGNNLRHTPSLMVFPLGDGQFLIKNKCDTCNTFYPLQLRQMPDGSLRDQPRCSKCRAKAESELKKYKKTHPDSGIPF